MPHPLIAPRTIGQSECHALIRIGQEAGPARELPIRDAAVHPGMKRVTLQPCFNVFSSSPDNQLPGSQPKCDIELVDRAVSPYPPSWLRARHNRQWLRQELVNMPQRVQTDELCFRAASPQSCSLASLRPGVDDAAWGHASPASALSQTCAPSMTQRLNVAFGFVSYCHRSGNRSVRQHWCC